MILSEQEDILIIDVITEQRWISCILFWLISLQTRLDSFEKSATWCWTRFCSWPRQNKTTITWVSGEEKILEEFHPTLRSYCHSILLNSFWGLYLYKFMNYSITLWEKKYLIILDWHIITFVARLFRTANLIFNCALTCQLIFPLLLGSSLLERTSSNTGWDPCSTRTSGWAASTRYNVK